MTSSLYDMFKTEADLETAGIDYVLSPTMSFRLARAGGANSNFTHAIDVKTRQIRKQIKGDKTSPEILKLLQQYMKEAFAETIILGWTGVTDEEGNELPCTPENALKVLNDLPDLFTELQEQAMELANFQAAALEDDLGNSSTSSDTSSKDKASKKSE
jgi:hypothetical protein